MPRLRPPHEPKKLEEDPKIEAPEPESDEPEVIVEDEPSKEDGAALALKKQIEELKKAEGVQRAYVEQLRQEREAILKAQTEQAKELRKYERDNIEQEEIAIDSTRSAAKAKAAKAMADHKNALDAGDNTLATEALNRLVDARAELQVLDQGREALKAKKKEFKKERKKLKEEMEARQATPASGDPIDRFDLPGPEKDWLRSHRDYITDEEKAEELRHAHQRAGFKGLKPGNPEYLPFINKTLFPENAPAESGAEQRQSEQRASIMSAPVSREAPSASGQRSSTRVTLSKDEKDFARISGVSEVEYAKQKQKLAAMKADGTYGDGR